MTRHTASAAALRALLAAMMWVLAVTSYAQDDGSLQQVVSGMEIYIGIMPAEVVSAYPREFPERAMHGGTEAGGYHVVVALFDQVTGRRITDANVRARLVAQSRLEPEKQLEPMVVGGAQTYGNYFDMVPGGLYRIDVQIRRPGSADAVRATFRRPAN